MKRILFSLLLLCCFSLCHAQIPSGSWSGTMEVQGVSLRLVFNLSGESCTLDVPDQGAKGIPVEASQTSHGALRIDIPAINAFYEGYRFGEKIIGTFSQHGVSFPMTLTQGVPVRKRPQTPQLPFPYTAQEVSFANGDAVLRGTLVLPENNSRATPVCLLVTGSGQQDRDETLFEHKPFAVIADYLARQGIATLRYDDRGFGESTGDVIHMTTEDLKQDAAAGLAFLRERFDCVGVIGHSEGGTIAFMLAAEKKADFIVSLAGMVISGAQTLLAQNRHALQAAGLDEATTESYCKALSETFDAVKDGRSLPSPADFDLPTALQQNLAAVQAQLGTPYLRYLVSLDLSGRLGDISCPVMALNGTRDTQVDCAANLEALEKGLLHRESAAGASIAAAPSPAAPARVQILPVEGVNHLFQTCQTGEAAEYPQIEETISPKVLVLIADWIASIAR